MTSESHAIRVSPLTTVLDGNNPIEFIHTLVDAGYDRFYVKVPQGFQASMVSIDPFPPGYQLLGPQQSVTKPSPDGNQSRIRYLRLDTAQLRELLQNPPIALSQFGGGGLASGLTRGGLVSIDFKCRHSLSSVLLPNSAAIADKVPAKFDISSVGPVVVKTPNRIRSEHSYVLHGIRVTDLFVEERALSDVLESMRTTKAVPASEDLPDDPYDLKFSSPLVYEILIRAYRNREKKRSDVDVPSLAAEFRTLNSGYKKNPKPFNDGRHDFAATFANPGYKYSPDGLGETDLPEETVEVPEDTFLYQDFINHRLRKLLYAACRWNGAKKPSLGSDREKLVGLLIGLGFFDREDNDQVQSLIFFITGEKYRRNQHTSGFRHMRNDRK